jgi:hypothetical protein
MPGLLNDLSLDLLPDRYGNLLFIELVGFL